LNDESSTTIQAVIESVVFHVFFSESLSQKLTFFGINRFFRYLYFTEWLEI
jgi:hypothetical protein